MGSYDRSTRDYIMKQAFSQSELHRRESLCVQEQPPFCLAKCPISLNGRALCSAVSSGDFVKGRGIIESLTPFVHILTRTCDGRCTAACKLAEIGDGISLRAVEQACVEHASAPLTRCLPTRKRDKRVAVLGDDLFCASLAWELSKKAYDVTLLIEHSCLCDALANEFPEIDKESIELDIATMNSYDCKITPVQNISSDYINSLRKDFDVICLSRDILNTHFPIVTVDCVTLLCESTAFFTESPLRGNTVDSLSDAKRAAASVDRFVQGVPVDRDRANEGSFETRLYTSLDGVSPSETLAREDNTPLSESEASSEAARCIGCECLECIKGCEFLRAYNRYPKKMLREIYNNLSIVMGDHSANKMINSCALCGQCTVVCPGGFDLSNACLLARETMVAAGKMPPSTHEFAMLDMQFSQSDGVFLTRNAQGKTISRYAFFPGCQMGAVLPGTTAAAYADLSSRLGGGVGLLLGCCGAIAKWAGRAAELDDCLTQLKSAYELLGRPTLIAACPTCIATLKEFVTEDIVGIWEILMDIGAPRSLKSDGVRMFVHDACGARGDKATQNTIRALARSLGVDVAQDTAFSRDKTACCGYGGLTAFSNREVATSMTDFAIAQGDGPYLTYCANCRDRFSTAGARTVHILELVYGAEDGGPLSLSERRANRKRLREKLLKQHWGEDVMNEMKDFKLEFSEDVTAMMDERMILEEDVYKTISAARDGGSVIRDKESGQLITTLRIGNVQFWVRYVVKDGTYVITSVYSHRMTVSEV